ncbi:MAG: hypothetical protein SGI87_10195 [Flavobacteriales bacterium]|nr:hypothetical protein [Flavobacteriales bacterium]
MVTVLVKEEVDNGSNDARKHGREKDKNYGHGFSWLHFHGIVYDVGSSRDVE